MGYLYGHKNVYKAVRRKQGLSSIFTDAAFHLSRKSHTGAEIDTAKFSGEREQKIFVTPDTKAQLEGIHEDLLNIAADVSNVDNLIIISRQDIVHAIGCDVLDLFAIKHMGRLYYSKIATFNLFRQQFSDHLPAITTNSAIEAYNGHATSGYVSDNDVSYGVMTLPNMYEETAHNFISMARIGAFAKDKDRGIFTETKVHYSDNENLRKAVTAYIILHESAHMGFRHIEECDRLDLDLESEQEADSIGYEVVAHLFPNYGDQAALFIQDSRAIGILRGGSLTHATNMKLFEDIQVSPMEQIEALAQIMDDIDDERDKQQTIHTFGESFKALFSRLSGKGKKPAYIDSYNNDRERFQLLCELNDAGNFAYDPVAQHYVDDLIDAVRRRVPEYFGIDPN